MKRIRMERGDGIGRIVLARPEKKNALDRVAADELVDALRTLDQNAETRVIVLAADGPDFCAGADLEALAGLATASREAHEADAAALGAVFSTIRTLGKPVIAAVQGRALAGGAGLATACDIVVAADDARFGYPEVTVGFVPAMVMTMLRRSVGEKRAFELVATGRTLGAREALEMGLVSRVVPVADLEAHVTEIASRAAKSAPGALRLTKALFYQLDELGFAAGIAAGARVNAEARDSDEFRAGLARFRSRGRSEG